MKMNFGPGACIPCALLTVYIAATVINTHFQGNCSKLATFSIVERKKIYHNHKGDVYPFTIQNRQIQSRKRKIIYIIRRKMCIGHQPISGLLRYNPIHY